MVKAAMEAETHQKTQPLNRIENPRLRKLTYAKRKECIKKKTMELGILCGIDACTVILGPNGEVDTWPENQTAVKSIIGMYRGHDKDRRSKKSAKPSGFSGWEDDWICGLPIGDLRIFLGDLQLKLQAVENRIGFLNILNIELSSVLKQRMQPLDFGCCYFPVYLQPLNCYGVSDQKDYEGKYFPVAENFLQPLPVNEAFLGSGCGFDEGSFNGYGDYRTGNTDNINNDDDDFAQEFAPIAGFYSKISPLGEALLGSGYGNSPQFLETTGSCSQGDSLPWLGVRKNLNE